MLDFIMVDEGQDLEDGVYSVLARASAHATVCLDAKQKIYDVSSTESGILNRLGIRRYNVSLIEAFRVCPYLVEIAAAFIPDEGEQNVFRNQTRQPQVEMETPILAYTDSFGEEKGLVY